MCGRDWSSDVCSSDLLMVSQADIDEALQAIEAAMKTYQGQHASDAVAIGVARY